MSFLSFKHLRKAVSADHTPNTDAWPGQSPGQDLPVDILENTSEDGDGPQKGGVAKTIARLKRDLDEHDVDAHEKLARIERAKLRDELDGGWARDQQRTSIWLFRAFGLSLILLFHFSLYVMLTTSNPAHEHLASDIMEMILASVIAGFLGYMLAKPFEHRR